MTWLTRLAFAALMLVNIALALCGVWVAMWTPMLVGTSDKVLMTIAVNIMLFPVLALVCAFLPWLFLWMRWRDAAVVTAIMPVVVAVAALAGLVFARAQPGGPMW